MKPSLNSTELILAGGLGNQIFRFLGGLKFSIHTKTSLVINTSWYKSNQNGKGGLTFRKPEIFYFSNLYDNFEFKEVKFPNLFNTSLSILEKFQNNKVIIEEISFEFLFRNRYFLNNSFESTKFFPSKSVINDLLKFSIETDPILLKLATQIRLVKPVVIHFRAGDHLNFPKIYNRGNLNYYNQALNMIFHSYGKRQIWLLTDDEEYAKNFFKDFKLDYIIEFPKFTNSVQILNLCSEINFFIGSESNFSWWIYYFANREKNLVNAVLPNGRYFKGIIHDSEIRNLVLL